MLRPHGFAFVATFALTLSTVSTAHASPPESTLAAPRMDPPAPVVVEPASDSLATTGEGLWTGLQGESVILELRDGSEARGTVIAQSTDEVGLAREADGMVVTVAKSDVASVRVLPRLEPPPAKQAGRGLIGGGAFLLAFGGAATLSGTTILAVFPEFTFIHLPLLLPGLAMLGGGAAMVAVGSKRKRGSERRWSTRVARPRLSPIVSAGNRSGYAGLVLSF